MHVLYVNIHPLEVFFGLGCLSLHNGIESTHIGF
jgi:hypothetical protein